MLKLKSVNHTYMYSVVRNPCLWHYGRLVCQITLEVTYQLSSISTTFINYDVGCDISFVCHAGPLIFLCVALKS